VLLILQDSDIMMKFGKRFQIVLHNFTRKGLGK
jgi:hypothetical protein